MKEIGTEVRKKREREGKRERNEFDLAITMQENDLV
jgi:hypothetical protein